MENKFEHDYNYPSIGGDLTASYTVSKEEYSMAVVSDGTAGRVRSNRGCRFAVDAFRECMEDTALVEKYNSAEFDNISSVAEEIVNKALSLWNLAVERDLENDPLSDAENPKAEYSAGFTVFVCGIKYGFGARLGDGICILTNRWGQLYQPLNRDGDCNKGSLSDDDAAEKIGVWYAEHFFDKDSPIAVFVGTGEIGKYFDSTLKMYDFFRSAILDIGNNSKPNCSDEPLVKLGEDLSCLCKNGLSLGVLLYRSAMSYDTVRWEGTGRHIYFNNYGDMDQDERGSRSYNHDAIIPAEVGSYSVWVKRGSERTVDILSVDDKEILLNFKGEDRRLTFNNQVIFRESERQASYDGPWFEADDKSTFTLMTE